MTFGTTTFEDEDDEDAAFVCDGGGATQGLTKGVVDKPFSFMALLISRTKFAPTSSEVSNFDSGFFKTCRTMLMSKRPVAIHAASATSVGKSATIERHLRKIASALIIESFFAPCFDYI